MKDEDGGVSTKEAMDKLNFARFDWHCVFSPICYFFGLFFNLLCVCVPYKLKTYMHSAFGVSGEPDEDDESDEGEGEGSDEGDFDYNDLAFADGEFWTHIFLFVFVFLFSLSPHSNLFHPLSLSFF